MFDDAWKIWIWKQIEDGCPKDIVFKVLHDEGFAFEAIEAELSHHPGIPLQLIVNPLRTDPNNAPQTRGANSSVFIPNAIREPHCRLELYSLENFLNEEECNALIEAIRDNLTPSSIIAAREEDRTGFRTSKTADLSTLDNALVRDIDRRISAMMGINPSYGEPLQGVVYDVGEEFKTHADYFDLGNPEAAETLANQGQRLWTFMVYLNAPEAGGATRFPHLDRAFTPSTGDALIWRNLDLADQPNPVSMHHAMAVEKGFKAVLTKWFRTQGNGEMFVRRRGEYLTNYTRDGILKTRIPDGIYNKILTYYRDNKSSATDELGQEKYIVSAEGTPSRMIELPEEMRVEIHAELKSLLEQWSNITLHPRYVYGIREYGPGAALIPHLDTFGTHIVSATLCIDHQVNTPWPMMVFDNYCRRHDVVLEPGEMLLYEGARLEHGRPTPLDGDFYSSVFVHYHP